MTESGPGAPQAAPGVTEPGLSPFSALAGTFASPANTFAGLVRRPTWWLPFSLWLCALVASMLVGTSRMDLDATIMEALEKNEARTGQRLPPESIRQQVEIAKKVTKFILVLSPIFGAAVFLGMAAILWGGGRAFGGENTFKQTLAIWAHANLVNVVGTVVSIPILLGSPAGSMKAKAIETAVRSNVGAFLPDDTGPVLASLASSLDLFSLATLALVVVGMKKMPELPTWAATAVPVGLWILYVLLKAAKVAVFPG